MFSRFTASARRVMQRAFREAKRWQHDFVGTEHLLYGLLCDAEGPAVVLLRSLNAHPELMLQKVELSLQRHDGGMTMEQFPLSPASKRVFQAAIDEAARFHHQLIGPPHILLALLRENDCEAAQILSAHGVRLEEMWSAIAALPREQEQDAKIQSEGQPQIPAGNNPSAAELERWIAPVATFEQETPVAMANLNNAVVRGITSPLQDVEAQVRRTQFVLATVLGFSVGFWLGGWIMGSLMAIGTAGIAACSRNSWVGIIYGAICGLIIVPAVRDDFATPFYPLAMGLLGGFLGSFLGDGWRFAVPVRVQQSPPHEPVDHEAETHDAVEDRRGRSNRLD